MPFTCENDDDDDEKKKKKPTTSLFYDDDYYDYEERPRSFSFFILRYFPGERSFGGRPAYRVTHMV